MDRCWWQCLTTSGKVLQTTLITMLDEQSTRNILDKALGEQGKIKQQKDVVENNMKRRLSLVRLSNLIYHIQKTVPLRLFSYSQPLPAVNKTLSVAYLLIHAFAFY